MWSLGSSVDTLIITHGLLRKHSAQLRNWQLSLFWSSSIIQLCRSTNGGKHMAGGRHPYAWWTCEWEYDLQPLAWIRTQCVASNSWDSRLASLVISEDQKAMFTVFLSLRKRDLQRCPVYTKCTHSIAWPTERRFRIPTGWSTCRSVSKDAAILRTNTDCTESWDVAHDTIEVVSAIRFI